MGIMSEIPGVPFMKVFHFSKDDSLTHVTIYCTWDELFALNKYLQDNHLYIGQQRIE